MIRRAAAIVFALTVNPALLYAQDAVLTVTVPSAEVYQAPSNVTPVIGHLPRGTMHTTPTVDIDLVLSGEVVLELDNGAITTLRPGDSVVQNGTRHRWRNEGTTAATIAFFICGADHEKFR